MRLNVTCHHCNEPLRRYKVKTETYFCDTYCKAEWQKTQRPVTVEWLQQKYINEGLDCTQISKAVNRDPKSVWNWLKASGIPTRKRGYAAKHLFKKGEPSRFKGKKHSAKTRRLFRKQKLESGSCPAIINGKHWLHVYKDRKPASWRGGITPERQAFYSTPEWKKAARAVWARDNRTCQRCGKKHSRGEPFDIHHIASFEYKNLRSEIKNLILLCETCHYWIHSKKNKKKLLIRTL